MVAIRQFLLIYWSVLAFLGHAGTHALADYFGICCHVDAETAFVSTESAAGIQTGHEGCSHCQRRQAVCGSPVGGGSSDGSDQGGPAGGTHDSANCHLCDWFARFTPADLALQHCLSPLPVAKAVQFPVLLTCSAEVPTERSRGPPLRPFSA